MKSNRCLETPISIRIICFLNFRLHIRISLIAICPLILHSMPKYIVDAAKAKLIKC